MIFPPSNTVFSRVFVFVCKCEFLSMRFFSLCRNYHAYITKSAAAGFFCLLFIL